MENIVLMVIGLVVLLGLVYGAFLLGRTKTAAQRAALAPPPATPTPAPPLAKHSDIESANFELLDDQGQVVIASRQLDAMPKGGLELSPTEGTGKLVTRLASDFFKAAVSIPGKTVEIVFHPHIQEGLRDGTFRLMRTETGEVLADAISSTSKQVVGKGRIVQTGQVNQLAAGAFQLVSIAVAQSHLADIERSLSALKGGISQIQDSLEASEVANIKGGITYLQSISELLKSNGSPDQLSMPMQVTIAQLVMSSNVWREKLFEDVRSLTKRIQNQQDADTWGGTGNTFQALLSHLETTDKLATRHSLYTEFMRLLDFLLIYIDPLKKNYARLQAEGAQWEELLSRLRSDLASKTDQLIKSRINNDEILQARKDKVNLKMEKFQRIGLEQLRAYEAFSLNLNERLDRMLSSTEGVRLAISFDTNGEVKRASLQ